MWVYQVDNQAVGWGCIELVTKESGVGISS